jgi:cytochrome oxidase Cu insertion factor (SCO1/SenC/PrrC family)
MESRARVSSSLPTLALIALLSAGAPAASSQGSAPAPVAPIPLEKRGPAVGSAAPPFRLRDQNDHEQTLATLSGKEGLVLLFVRSADW